MLRQASLVRARQAARSDRAVRLAEPGERRTVAGMTFARRRGYTLIELTVTMAVAGVLAAAGGISGKAMLDRSADGHAASSVEAVAAAQQLRYRSQGRFIDDVATLRQLSAGPDFTSGAADSAGQVATKVGAVDGYDAVGIAIRSKSGTCLGRVTIAHVAGIDDRIGELPGPCTGAAALNLPR